MATGLAAHAALGMCGPLHRSSLPGNVNFDPLSLATLDAPSWLGTAPPRREAQLLYDYREAELKHGRLAMLATVAFPAQEWLHPWLATELGASDALATGGLSPSLVNGGLDAATLGALFAVGSAVELDKLRRPSYIAADYGWSFGAATPSDRFDRLQEAEIWHARLAMVAALGYVAQEGATGAPLLAWLGA